MSSGFRLDKYEMRRFFRTGTVTQSVGCLDGNDIILVVVAVRINNDTRCCCCYQGTQYYDGEDAKVKQ